jgi:hypothetical protein
MIFGDKCISWIDLSSPQKISAFVINIITFAIPWNFLWSKGFGFEYTIEQFAQIGIAVLITAVFCAFYHILKPKS